jgi:hypothetical protein
MTEMIKIVRRQSNYCKFIRFQNGKENTSTMKSEWQIQERSD